MNGLCVTTLSGNCRAIESADIARVSSALAELYVMVLLPDYNLYILCTLPSMLENKLSGQLTYGCDNKIVNKKKTQVLYYELNISIRLAHYRPL